MSIYSLSLGSALSILAFFSPSVTPGTSRLTFYYLSHPSVKRAHLFPDGISENARADVDVQRL